MGTTGLANETALGLDMVNSTLVQVKQLVRMHGKVIATANEAIKNINNKDSIKEINKEMTYVKTRVVEFCGYQSSWGKEDKSVTYEYVTVSENTVDESNGEER